MQSKLLRSLGLAALVAASPVAVMAQETPTPPAEPTPPEVPPPPGEPTPAPQPGDPIPEPPAPPAPEPMPEPPTAPMATPPGGNAAQSGATTTAAMTPVAATKEYPLCTREIQDSCRNPGEGPKRTKKPR
jgi:hypothetical protein